MVDHINRINDNAFRVHESKDAMDDEEQKKKNEDEDQKGESDSFDKLSNKTDWNILFDKNHLWQRNIEVKVEDIDRIKLLGLNIKTNPSLLKIRVFLFDGTTINTAFLTVSRYLAMQIKNKNESLLDVNTLTNESILRLTLPTDEAKVDEEITNIGLAPVEKTFSKTFKMLVLQKGFLQRLGIRDPVSKRINTEIMWIYITVIVLLSVIIFTALFLFI